jgi:tRNA G18 (ribose-2'-O)-methylase SpoU
MIEIISPFDQRVSDYRLLKSKEEDPNIFIADHEKTVIRLLKSNITIKSVYSTIKYINKYIDLINEKINNNQLFYSDIKIFEETIGFSVHQGMMAVGMTPSMREPHSINNPIILCNSLVDTQNMGSIIRTSGAFGINSIVLDEKCVSPFLRRSIRVSMGNIFDINFYRSKRIIDDLRKWKIQNFKILALSLPFNSSLNKFNKIGDFNFPEKFILILGNEGYGIDEEIKKECDEFIYIPMYSGVDSLNVSHSLAVALSFWKKGI